KHRAIQARRVPGGILSRPRGRLCWQPPRALPLGAGWLTSLSKSSVPYALFQMTPRLTLSSFPDRTLEGASVRANAASDPGATYSRRDFCKAAGALLLAVAAGGPLAWADGFRRESPEKFDVVALDRARVLAAAQRYLKEHPITVTASTSDRSPGGRHDYFSEADYFWPDPKNPHGPYIQRDGFSNPSNFLDHRRFLLRFSVQASALAAAWRI